MVGVVVDKSRWVRPVGAVIVGGVFFLPLYMVLANVIKEGPRISSDPMGLPLPPTLDNLSRVVTRPDGLFWVSLTNSVVITTVSVLVLTVLSAMLGHYLARSRSRWARAATVLLLCGLMIPPQVILLPDRKST